MEYDWSIKWSSVVADNLVAPFISEGLVSKSFANCMKEMEVRGDKVIIMGSCIQIKQCPCG